MDTFVIVLLRYDTRLRSVLLPTLDLFIRLLAGFILTPTYRCLCIC